MRNRTRTADALGSVPVAIRPPIQPSSVAPMMTTPPMVGVPRLVKCAVGPSCRMNWPYCLCTRNRMNRGVPSSAMSIARPPEIRTALIGRPPRPAGRPASRGPAPYDDFTSTTSPGRSSLSRNAVATARSSASTTSSPHEPSWLAPSRMARAPSPTTIVRPMLSRTHRRPIASCASRASGAELEHLAEHRDRAPVPPGQDGQRLERGAHRVRVGVVGVVDDGDAVGPVDHVHAVRAEGVRGAEPGGHLVEVEPDGERRGGRAERVVHVVLADEPQRRPRRSARSSPRPHERERRAPGAVEAHVADADRRLRGGAERHDVAGRERRHRGHARVVGVEHGDAVRRPGPARSRTSRRRPRRCRRSRPGARGRR